MQKKKQEWRPLTDRLTQAKDGQHPILVRKKQEQAEPSNATDGYTVFPSLEVSWRYPLIECGNAP